MYCRPAVSRTDGYLYGMIRNGRLVAPGRVHEQAPQRGDRSHVDGVVSDTPTRDHLEGERLRSVLVGGEEKLQAKLGTIAWDRWNAQQSAVALELDGILFPGKGGKRLAELPLVEFPDVSQAVRQRRVRPFVLAGLSGATIPLILKRLGADPALIDTTGAHGITLLTHASWNGDVELTELLWQRGARTGACSRTLPAPPLEGPRQEGHPAYDRRSWHPPGRDKNESAAG